MSDPSFFAGEDVPAGKLQDLGETATWTPALTAATTPPTLGAGAILDGDRHHNGRLATVRFNIAFGTSGTNAGSGNYQIVLPSELTLDAAWSSGLIVGGVTLNNSGSSLYRQLRTLNANAVIMVAEDGTTVTHAVPFAWGVSDFMRGSFTALLA